MRIRAQIAELGGAALMLLGLACVLSGCKAREEQAASAPVEGHSPPPETVAEGTHPGESPRASERPQSPSPPAAASVNGVVDPNLTAQLRIFVQQNGRLPESFAEFAGARLDSVPRLHPTLTFAIDPATQEVKIVRKQ